MLAEARPRLLIEVYEENAGEVGRMLKGYGYVLYDAELRPERRAPLSKPSYNTVALPDGGFTESG